MTRLVARNFKHDGLTLFLTLADIVYAIAASKLSASVFFTRWHNTIPTGTTGVIVRSATKGPVHLSGGRSTRQLRRSFLSNDDFVEVSRGVVVNLAYVEGEADPRENLRILVLNIGGVREGIAMSRRGAARLHAALAKRLRRGERPAEKSADPPPPL